MVAAEARARWRGERGAARCGAEGSCRSAAPCGHRVSAREGSGLLLAPPPRLVPPGTGGARPASDWIYRPCLHHPLRPSCRCGGRSWGQGRVGSVGLLSALSLPSPTAQVPETPAVLFLLRVEKVGLGSGAWGAISLARRARSAPS